MLQDRRSDNQEVARAPIPQAVEALHKQCSLFDLASGSFCNLG